MIEFIQFCSTMALVFIIGVWFGASGSRRG